MEFNHLDNENSTSRFGVKATAKGANLTIQAKFEWQFACNENRNDLSQHVRGGVDTNGAKLGGFKIKSKIAHSNNSSTARGQEDMTGGSISVLHNSGVSATYSYVALTNRTDSDALQSGGRAVGRQATHYGKVGYQASFTDLGKTYMGVDFERAFDG
ncbi:MAG TPA: hypothetical protein ENI79_03550, partial [Rhodospirillales bacterium]|nr:hypothetical protein [Rhodospirillales bacterium]